ncbi:MAG: hypothetical protein ACLP1D_09775, partial [Xanthobacteraceae bacterium]
ARGAVHTASARIYGATSPVAHLSLAGDMKTAYWRWVSPIARESLFAVEGNGHACQPRASISPS